MIYSESYSSKCIMTITGIRPDFIRMSAIFKLLDQHFNHILVHTGQHYDNLLSGVFFEQLEIRQPDFTLETGKNGGTHYHQLGYLSVAIIDLIKNKNLKPDLILFLGDANTASAALPLRKEGYTIGHIEAGMRSYDKRMLEEINRTVCDHCSHLLFVYHQDYLEQLKKENIIENVHVVGNTIVEVVKPFIPTESKKNNLILLDIHRPENYKYPDRMKQIIKYANDCSKKYQLPVKMLKFFGTCKFLGELQIDLGTVELVNLMSFKQYISTIYHCLFIISDSGTAQEEPALLNTPVIVPRDFSERPQSIENNCSFMLNVSNLSNQIESYQFITDIQNGKKKIMTDWLGEGETAQKVVDTIINYFR